MKRKFLYLLGAGCILGILVFIFIRVTGSQDKIPRINDFNLLVISLDTMRADRVGAYGCPQAQTPNLDFLAWRGVMFENCYAPVPITLPAHCSLFTGRYPLGHRVRDNGTFFLATGEITLAEQMKSLGHRTFAAVASFVLLAKFGLNQGFDIYDDGLNIDEMITDLESEIDARQVYQKFNRWFRQFPEGEKFFAWIHFYDPHAPYKPPAEFRVKFSDDLLGQYDAEVAFTDLYVGKIIDDLKTRNLLSRTLVIVVGDHGEAFGEHLEFGHALFCYEANLRVPLIFFNRHLIPNGKRIYNRVNLIDIMPTILELYGRETPGRIQGISFTDFLIDEKEPEDRTFLIESMHGREEFGWAPLTGIISDHFKFISLPEPELYDLSIDPHEKDNLFLKKNRLAKKMDRQLLEMVEAFSQSGPDSRRRLNESDRQHLETLGYISTFSGKTQTAIDPKKGILYKNELTEIEKKIAAEDLDEAENLLKKMQRENPDMILPQYFSLWDTIFLKRKAPQQIVDNWKEAVKKFPENPHLKMNLASEYFFMNKLDAARKLTDEIIALDPRHSAAFILSGRIEDRRQQKNLALQYFNRALELESHNVSLKIRIARLLAECQQKEETESLCRQLLEDEAVANHPDMKSEIGILLTEIHKDEIAFEVLKDIAEQEKGDAQVWNYLGILYFRKKDFTKAREAYRKSIELDSSAAVTHNNLATLYLTLFLKQRDSQFYQHAMTAYNKALDLDPNLVSALNGRASAYKFANRIPEALDDWKKILRIKSDFTDAYLNMAVTYLQMGAQTEALYYLKTCRDKHFHALSQRDQVRIERLIEEAGGTGQ